MKNNELLHDSIEFWLAIFLWKPINSFWNHLSKPFNLPFINNEVGLSETIFQQTSNVHPVQPKVTDTKAEVIQPNSIIPTPPPKPQTFFGHSKYDDKISVLQHTHSSFMITNKELSIKSLLVFFNDRLKVDKVCALFNQLRETGNPKPRTNLYFPLERNFSSVILVFVKVRQVLEIDQSFCTHMHEIMKSLLVKIERQKNLICILSR